jgi:hypothetical protein
MSIYGTCTNDDLTVLCRLMFEVLTATDEALVCVDQGKLGVVYGLSRRSLRTAASCQSISPMKAGQED